MADTNNNQSFNKLVKVIFFLIVLFNLIFSINIISIYFHSFRHEPANAAKNAILQEEMDRYLIAVKLISYTPQIFTRSIKLIQAMPDELYLKSFEMRKSYLRESKHFYVVLDFSGYINMDNANYLDRTYQFRNLAASFFPDFKKPSLILNEVNDEQVLYFSLRLMREIE